MTVRGRLGKYLFRYKKLFVGNERRVAIDYRAGIFSLAEGMLPAWHPIKLVFNAQAAQIPGLRRLPAPTRSSSKATPVSRATSQHIGALFD